MLSCESKNGSGKDWFELYFKRAPPQFFDGRYLPFCLRQRPISKLVEVAGIEPASLSNPIKVATCLVYLLDLILRTPVNRIAQAAAF